MRTADGLGTEKRAPAASHRRATFGLGLTMGVFGLWAEALSGPSGGDRVVLHPTEPHPGGVDGCSARKPGKHLVSPTSGIFPHPVDPHVQCLVWVAEI
jgi:hypothetical protein